MTLRLLRAGRRSFGKFVKNKLRTVACETEEPDKERVERKEERSPNSVLMTKNARNNCSTSPMPANFQLIFPLFIENKKSQRDRCGKAEYSAEG